MPKEGNKGVGSSVRTKGSGSGGNTNLQRDLVGDNEVLSNRDKSSKSGARGQDGKRVQSDQYQSHDHDKQPDE
jgi:hypothetical protein